MSEILDIGKNAIYAIEKAKKLNERNDDNYKDDGERRCIDPPCWKCNDDDKLNCRECGCHVCSKKTDEDKMLICDECQHYFHLWCLSPKLDKVPDDDWYCDNCVIDKNEIIQVGDVSKRSHKNLPSDTATKKWGGGYACTGLRVKASVPTNHKGPVPGVEVGSSWQYRFQASEAGVHCPIVQGIHGRANDCAYSIVLSGGYEDDVDNGDWFEYTGSGGRDLSGNKRTAKQSFDQTLTRSNRALALNCNAPLSEKGAVSKNWKDGIPIRVIRKADLRKNGSKNPYAPEKGFRYDGIYKVESYKPVKGKSGFIVWRYKLRRDDPAAAPWTDEGKKRIEELGLSIEEVEVDKPGGKRPLQDWLDKTNTKKRKLFDVDEQIRKLAKKDVLNKKMWDDILSENYNSSADFKDRIAEILICLYCLQIVDNPSTTPCGHNMCAKCLRTAWKNKFRTCIKCHLALPNEYEKPSINKELADILKVLHAKYGI